MMTVKNTIEANALLQKAGRFRRFAQDDSGTVTTYALGLFVCMVMMGGFAVDLMRYEATRTHLQQTLDRSTLAAASLTQNLDPTNVVNDYFAKAGLAQNLTSVEVEQGVNFRNVTADAHADTDPIFMHMLGIDQFDALSHSQAEQRITNVDISLVLDISGSMNLNNRLSNLKTAAKEFVDTVLSSDGDDKIAVQIVPFNGQVNLGATLSARYNLTQDHGIAGVDCVDLPTSVYSTTGITNLNSNPTSALALPVTAHADTFTSVSQSSTYSTSNSSPNSANRWCPPSTTNIVRLPTNSISALQGYIDGLSAVGATSINAGMKWGLTLLDPTSRPMFAYLSSVGQIPSQFNNRPFDFTDDESLKVVVLMTDGEHFAEERVKPDYKAGPSTIWQRTSTSEYSVFHQSKVVSTNATTICNSRPFYVPHLNAWHSRPWNGTTPSSSTCYSATAAYTGATNLSWPQVWTNFRLQWVAWNFYALPLGTTSSARTTQYNYYLGEMREQTPTTTMDNQLSTICSLAKNNGVVVYGIAFEAPTNGQAAIRNCATSNAHYFNASGLQIRTAFRTIANNISQLRLTQ